MPTGAPPISPVRERPVATYAIIGAYVLVFLAELCTLQSADPEALVNQWGLTPATFLRGVAPWTLITSMLIHGGIFHLLSNMYVLWVFGDNVEDHLGVGRYLALYMLGGVVGALVQIASNPHATDAMAGASGAISAVAGAYVYLFPNRRFYVMIFDILLQRVRAIWLLGIWIAFQLALAVLGVSGVAWWAHIGGFAFGVGAAALYRYSVARRIEALESSGG